MEKRQFFTTKMEYTILQNVLLSARNPRFTKLSSIKNNLFEIITKDLEITTQQEIANKLLAEEDDLKKFLDLLKSITTVKFDGSTDLIFVQYKNKYVVAEGNRRILCLKILAGLIVFPSRAFFINSNNPYNKMETDSYWKQKEEFNERITKNYDKIQTLIYTHTINFMEKYKGESFFPTITDSNDYLWKRLHAKHVNGQAVGLRNWSRGQYFLNLLGYFKEKGLDLNPEEKTVYESRLQKEFRIIKSDYRHAQMVYKIAESDSKNQPDMIRYFLIKNKVSALQEQFWNKTLSLVVSEVYGYKWEDIKEEYYKIEYAKKTGQMVPEKSEFMPEFLQFIKRWFLKKLLVQGQTLNDMKITVFLFKNWQNYWN